MTSFAMIGAGGHARVVRSLLTALGHDLAGYFVPKREQGFENEKWLGNDDTLLSALVKDTPLALGIGSMPGTSVRRRIFNDAEAAGFRFPSLAHPSAIVVETELSDGVQIMAGAVVQCGTVIGKATIVNSSATVDHDCTIGDHCHISPGAVLCGTVVIGTNSYVGAGSVIKQNISVGSNCVIGAGAVVLQDVPDGQTVFGVPARPYHTNN